MKKVFDVNDDAQVDRFNELYDEACKRLGLRREEVESVTFAQAAEVLGLTEASVRRYAYANPPKLELGGETYKGRGVTLDSVIIRLMTSGRRANS
jgi:hypothetical protein